MDRAFQHPTGRPRRWTTGVALVAAAALVLLVPVVGLIVALATVLRRYRD